MIENYAWVDECLRQMYYSYALTVENCDEYEDAGLLTEKWAWVDEKLEEMYNEDKMPILAPEEWTDCSYNKLECIEEFKEEFKEEFRPMPVSKKRTRSESDISEYEDCISAVVKRINRCFANTEMKEV